MSTSGRSRRCRSRHPVAGRDRALRESARGVGVGSLRAVSPSAFPSRGNSVTRSKKTGLPFGTWCGACVPSAERCRRYEERRAPEERSSREPDASLECSQERSQIVVLLIAQPYLEPGIVEVEQVVE